MPQYNERWETSARQRLPTTLDTMDCVTRDKYRRRSSRLCHDQGGPVKRRLKFPQGCAIEARTLRRLIACSGKSTNQDVVWLRRGLSASEILTALVAVSGSILPMIKKPMLFGLQKTVGMHFRHDEASGSHPASPRQRADGAAICFFDK